MHHFTSCIVYLDAGYSPPQQRFYLESSVRVTCDVGNLCANFSLPRPLCSLLRPDVRDRQKDRRQTRIIAKYFRPMGRVIIM